MDDNDLTLHDLAGQVLKMQPAASKREWGEQLLHLADLNAAPGLTAEIQSRLVSSCGAYVSSVKAQLALIAENDRLLQYGVSHEGRPVGAMTPTVSVRNEDGSTQLLAWVEASPQQFIDAVQREQNVIDGRNRSNRMRRKVADMILGDDELLGLPNLAAVCAALGVDPDGLNLTDLDVG